MKNLIEVAQAAMTTSISIRLPQGDIDAAKRIAAKTCKKYQTILKELIHEGLERS